MPDVPNLRDRDATTTLSAGQRDWIRREGRVARALEAAQRRSGRRFVRLPPKSRGREMPALPGSGVDGRERR